MKRAIVLLMDSFGIGSAADAPSGDRGANTFVHIVQACAMGKADMPGKRQGKLHIPNLVRLGLINAAIASQGGRPLPEMDSPSAVIGAYGYAKERSLGKDTPSGHWEIAGVPVLTEWGYFAQDYPSFPEKLIHDLVERGNLPGILGNRHASGTVIIDELGQEHMETGKPIVYTSADSVFQIAAHEETFGLERLYALCNIARELVDEYNIGRVIARPFIGTPGQFQRTGNRRDLATPPPAPTLFDKLLEDGGTVVAIGKTADIYAHQGITHEIKANGNKALFDATVKAMDDFQDRSLIFTNFVDFDMNYGHRRDVAGYALALEEFDRQLPELIDKLLVDDIVVITADHGCDPTWPGSDHTREHIPVIVFGPCVPSGYLGERQTFADIGQSLATHLGLAPLACGESFIHADGKWSIEPW
ncbi:MAG: phosphopentomutase [Legionellales bacterium]|nr:phosphopentomutase [Legionellales bacterium]